MKRLSDKENMQTEASPVANGQLDHLCPTEDLLFFTFNTKMKHRDKKDKYIGRMHLPSANGMHFLKLNK